MPWVRLHAVKDYLGMALLLDEVPELHATVNLVPSLLRQIEGYLEGGEDVALRLTKKAAADLTDVEQEYLLDHFFSANHEHLIDPFPRFRELRLRRQFGRLSAGEARRHFRERDFRDLQVWFNLAWMGPLNGERDPILSSLIEKGAGFSDADKEVILEIQKRAMAEVIPLHRKLQDRGQVELTTTPYFHPILPLLIDPASAREAMPGTALPNGAVSLADDAREHLRLAREAHARWFGRAPRGLWPSEGSVSEGILPLVLDAGFEWAATDEEILFQSLGIAGRDGNGHLADPAKLYRPWSARCGDRSLSFVFRDHSLSDFIGFQAHRMDDGEAVSSFIRWLEGIRDGAPDGEEPLVSVILDGENAWEYFRDNGVPFLRRLYREIARTPWIQTTTVSGYLDAHEKPEPLPRLFAGSWIHHNFYIWIGHTEDRAGWEYLHKTRRAIQGAIDRGGAGTFTDAARDSLFAAEGSDWFWWYGDDHSSGHDEEFDALFRTHLENAHTFAGLEPPPWLSVPISRPKPAYRAPTGYVQPALQGRRKLYFEWVGAGRYVSDRAQGAIARSSHSLVRALHFGFDETTLYLRFDFRGDVRSDLLPTDEIDVTFVRPVPSRIEVRGPEAAGLDWRATLVSETVRESPLRIAADQTLELACPFEGLGFEPGRDAEFYVEVKRGGHFLERHPQYGTIVFRIPTAEFESEQWHV